MRNTNIYLSTLKNEISNKFLCSDCINELKQKDNRRFYYLFIGCNNCGEYFSIILVLFQYYFRREIYQ